MGAQSLNFDSIQESCNQLTTLAGNFSDTIDSTNAAIAKITNPTWEGKAATAYTEKIKTLVNNLPAAKQQLALSVLFLTSCANAYDQLGEESIKKLKDLVGGQEYIDNYDLANAPTVDLNSRYNIDNSSSQNTQTDSNGQVVAQYSTNNASSHTNTGSGNSSYSYSVGAGTAAAAVTAGDTTTSGDTDTTITGIQETAQAGQEVEIPDSVKQGSYTVTGYDYWINSGREMSWAEGTNQKKVSEIWKEQGSRFKNGIAVINVDGEDRYLVAVTTKFGQAGDCLDVKLADGTTVKCVIGDSKGSDAGSEWGHVLSDGSINVLEFEVQREKYIRYGNPTTEKWGLDWDSNQSVKSIKNTGSIIGAQSTNKTVLTTNNANTVTANADDGTTVG